ncbi:fibronectin type III domain-containing protein [Actinomadura macra]|uniref:fibronectin type III domain-containing protein n=1 Tax=Actinomadura macra TaxID=46164 RepID=UPI000835C6D7|nr:fibronectin type III domain-containing protein [Actinomadura macra]
MSGDRSPARATGLRGFFRRDRITGQIAIGLVGVLCVSALVYGVGSASARYKLADVGAWLSAGAKGLVVHANGLAGKVDGKAGVIPQMRGHHIRIVQDGTTVLLIDEDTGVVSRIDPSQLKITQSRVLGGSALQVVAGAGTAYTVDLVKGAVQQIDPLTLAPVGQGATLPAPLSAGGIDAAGTLWVPVPQNGHVVPFQNGRQGRAVVAGAAGDRLALTMAAGTPVITNSTSATALVVRAAGSQKINLPAPVSRSAAGVKVPPVADGQVVPMLGAGGALYLLNTAVGRVDSVALRMPRHQFESPHVLGSRVYLPDRTSGQLLVFNTDRNAWERPITATRPGGTIEILVRDHMLWVNDPDGSTALAFDPDGAVKRIKKYEDKIPGSARRPIPAPNPGGGNGNRANGGGRGPGGSTGAGPPWTPPAPPKPPGDGTPSEPQVVRVDPLSGGARVTFAPSAGGRPEGYVLKGAEEFQVRPRRVPAGASPSFTLAGGSCDKSYQFTVAVQYEAPNGRRAEKESRPSMPVRPCVAPGQPTGFAAAGEDHGARLTWSAAPGTSVVYRVTGTNAPGEVTGTSATVSGLTNDASYPYTLVAKNGAGESTAVTAIANLAYRRAGYRNKANNQTNTIIRPGPAKTGEVGRISQGTYQTLTLICQVRGENVREAETGETSVWWNRIEWNGGVGYLSVTLMEGPRSPGGSTFECA